MTSFNCQKCGLHDGCLTPNMRPDDRTYPVGIDDAADVMIIGEAPGAQEDREGTPFIGKSGVLLKNVIDEAGLQHYGLIITNVIRCRPPGNKTPTLKQIRCCIEENLLSEIEEYNPAIVMLLGNVPLKAVLGESGITNWRGVVVEKDGRIYVPTYHPAYVLRNTAALGDMLSDFDLVYELVSGEREPERGYENRYALRFVDTVNDAECMRDVIKKAGRCGFDLEVTSLDPFGEDEYVIMASFSVNARERVAWAVQTYDDDIIDVCIEILEDDGIEKVGHNIKFDQLICLALWDTWVENVVGDSMLLSYVLEPQPGRHGLKMLAGRHLGMYNYDEELREYVADNKVADPTRGGSYAYVPVGILSRYAALDAIATLELHDFLCKDLLPKQLALYEELLIPASSVLVIMESNGVLLDQSIVSAYTEMYEDEKDEQFAVMLDDRHVKRYTRKRLADNGKYEFNPNSHVQMKDVLYGADYYGLEPLGHTDTGAPSVKWDFLKPYANDVPFLRSYRYYRLLGKMLNTYLVPASGKWVSQSDGRTRSSYLLHGTVTGRLASRSPNLQNIPTPEKEPDTLLASHPIKNIFTHTWENGCLFAADYSGMELRTMASVSQCQGMIDVFEQGLDLHSIVTCYLFGLEFDKFASDLRSLDGVIVKAAAALRYRAKWVNWTLLYGGDEYTLHRLYGIELDEAILLVNKYYDMFPEVLEFREKTLAFARNNGYVESPFGRRRYLPYINDASMSYRAKAEREAVNMPIQSAASDVLLAALIVLNDCMLEEDYKSMMVNTVHDSVMFDVYPGELDDLAIMCKDVMENISLYAEDWFPRLDFSWITVPLVADMEYGSHYGSLKHYEVH